MFLISTEGKSQEQILQETLAAFQKYQQVEQETIQQLLSEGKITQEQALELQKQAVPSLENPTQPQEQANSSGTPTTTPPMNVPKVSTEEFWNRVDKTNQESGLVTQITGYPRPPQAPLAPPQPPAPEGMQVVFFQKKPEEYRRQALEREKSKKWKKILSRK